MVNFKLDKNYRAEKVCVLGSTGSIGTQSLDIVRELGLKVSMLTCGENTDLFAEQIKEFSPALVGVGSEKAAVRLKESLGGSCPEILTDKDEILDAVRGTDADLIIHSVAGLAGTGYAVAAAESGKRIGMANKEAVIALGEVIFDALDKSGGTMIPVDSEHSAIYRCLEGHSHEDVNKIVLTASGGPFFGMTRKELADVTVERTLVHPTWKMGKKITVDSATLMNKGFEIIEAVKLFGVPEDKVDVAIHRQSIIHSMVEYTDRTLLAELGRPDMRDCIRYAATAPHTGRGGESLDFAKIGQLTFFAPDYEAFPLLMRAREAIRTGGCAPAALIAADEAAVAAFLNKKIGFNDISDVVMKTMETVNASGVITYENVREATLDATRKAEEFICRI